MNKACIVNAHGAGLFSNINKVITCMEVYDHVHVDWSNEDNLYRTAPNQDPNAWNHLFNPTSKPKDDFDVLIDYPHQDYTWKQAGKLYRSETDWRIRLNKQWKKLTVSSSVVEKAMTFSGFMIGVLVRSNAIAGEQESNTNASLNDYVFTLKKALNEYQDRHPRVYAVCSDEQSAMKFIREFNASVYPHTRRAESRAVDQHMEHPQTITDAKNCLAEVLSLSRCDVLIHQISNMATAALYMNPHIKSVYLR